MKKFDLISKLVALDYRGIDADLETSLFEYGFIALDIPETRELQLIICSQHYQENFKRIITGWFSYQDIDSSINESWFHKEHFFSFLGCNESEWLNQSYIMKIYDLFSYYGFENFGFSFYNSFSLLEFARLYK
jgi:hypothetical protein